MYGAVNGAFPYGFTGYQPVSNLPSYQIPVGPVAGVPRFSSIDFQGAIKGLDRLYAQWGDFAGKRSAQVSRNTAAQEGSTAGGAGQAGQGATAQGTSQQDAIDPLFSWYIEQQKRNMRLWQGILTQAATNLSGVYSIAMGQLQVNDVQSRYIAQALPGLAQLQGRLLPPSLAPAVLGGRPTV